MSLILRQLLRDPLVVGRPVSRALSRRHNDWHPYLDHWVPRKRRTFVPTTYDPQPFSWVEQMNREMAHTMNKMAEDLEALDELVERTSMEVDNLSPRRVKNKETIVRRTETGGLQLALDVEGFKPEELKIRLVDDNLVVEALSESSGEDSYQRSQFKRWFKLPEDCKLEEIKSKLTQDNKLLIDLPTNKPIEDSKARSIPIEMEKATTAEKNTHGQVGSHDGSSSDTSGAK